MKLSAALSYLLVILPVLVQGVAIAEDSSALVARQAGKQCTRQTNNNNGNVKKPAGGNNGNVKKPAGGNNNGGKQQTGGNANGNTKKQNGGNNNGNVQNGGNKNGNNNGNNGNNNNNNNGQNNGNNNGQNGGNNNNGGGDPQTSLTLDPKVIAKGFASTGQENGADPGQVASLTSTNNYINFCLTVNKPLTNGQQITGGSCNPAPIGVIASTANMPSSKFVVPKNGDTLPANQAFTIKMAMKNLQTGNFVNAQTNYYSAPQQVNAQGNIIGHTHVVIEQLQSLDQTTPLDPTRFAFFKGVNGAAVNGVVSADVTNGLPAGVYRIASINAAANHQPVLVAVAQHGSLDDMAYFTVTDGANNGGNNNNNNGGNNNGQNGGQNKGGQNNGKQGQNGQNGGGQNGQNQGRGRGGNGNNQNRNGQQGGRRRQFSREAF